MTETFTSTYRAATPAVRKMSLQVSTEPEQVKDKIWEVVKQNRGILPDAAQTLGCSLRVMYAWLRKLELLDDAKQLRQEERTKMKAEGKPIFIMKPREPKPLPKKEKGRGRKAAVVGT